MKVILAKSPNNEVDSVLIGYFLSPYKASSSGTRLYPIELLAKENPQKFPNYSGNRQQGHTARENTHTTY